MKKVKRGYRKFEWEDETSMYDPKGRWLGGSECYERTYKAMIPVRLKEENALDWIEEHYEEDIWLD